MRHIPMLAALLLSPCAAVAQPSEEAVDLAKRFIIVDGHVDAPTTIIDDGADVATGRNAFDFDYERAKAGGLDAPFMSIYVAATFEDTGGAKARADMLIGLMEAVAAQHADKFTFALRASDVEAAHKAGKIALPLGMENGSPIEGDLRNLQHFYDRGIRYITLAHSKSNHISDSSYDDNEKWDGLSPFGVEVVKAMNSLGMMIDVSHLTDAAVDDVLATTTAPVIASHSSLRHFTPDWHRNLPDELVTKIGENGGIVMINFGSSFLISEAREYSTAYYAARDTAEAELGRTMTAVEREKWDADYRAEKPYPYANLDNVLDHIDRTVELAGIDHVGIGSDYDGVGDSLPEGLKDVSTFPVLVQGLLDRDYSEEDIEKILGGNLLRVWKAVEKKAR